MSLALGAIVIVVLLAAGIGLLMFKEWVASFRLATAFMGLSCR